jgi:hypothetical protein
MGGESDKMTREDPGALAYNKFGQYENILKRPPIVID